MTQKQRTIHIAGNWKMNHGPKATEDFLKEFAPMIQSDTQKSQLKVTLFPPLLSLYHAVNMVAQGVTIGAQNAHYEHSGAFTGEISGDFLKEINIHSVLIGHSERRQYFGETNELIGKKVTSLIKQDFEVMVCVGETKEERERNETETILSKQLEGAFSDQVEHAFDGRIAIAYEPVWAIGTGLTATPEQAEQTHQFIRKWLWDRFGMAVSGRTSILYGGSVKPDNIDKLLSCPNIDGALVGGASLKADSLASLVHSAAKALA